jgi:Zn ribbon nucleic-acid-binding protein
MSQEAIDKATRRARRKRTVGGAPCQGCAWADVTALTKPEDSVSCYECGRDRDGKPTTEAHHIQGRANDPATVQVPGNLHRMLSDNQIDWPIALKSNPDRDPLIWLAQACRGLYDHLAVWVTNLKCVSIWLAALSEALRRTYGPTWWTTLGIPSLWEGMAS